ncbi:hypothetical protein GCM10009551_011730 [Nocardiopsis tropica]
MTRVRVTALTMWAAEKARETVETWTPLSRATSLMVTATRGLRSVDVPMCSAGTRGYGNRLRSGRVRAGLPSPGFPGFSTEKAGRKG